MPTAREYNDMRKGSWVGDLGIEIVSGEPGRLIGLVAMRKELLSPNGFLHAGCIVTFADSMCGSGTMENLPSGARGYTTIELKANLLGTTREGHIECEATLVHGGRTTQVWDAKVTSRESGKTLRCFDAPSSFCIRSRSALSSEIKREGSSNDLSIQIASPRDRMRSGDAQFTACDDCPRRCHR